MGLRNDILEALGDLIIDGERAKKVIDEYLSHVVLDVWRSEDILMYAEDDENSIIDSKEAEEILGNIRHRYNANLGITWNFIAGEIDHYIEERVNNRYELRIGERIEI